MTTTPGSEAGSNPEVPELTSVPLNRRWRSPMRRSSLLSILAASIALVIPWNAGAQTPATFTVSKSAAPQGARLMAQADLNGDGRLDLVTATRSAPYKISVFLAGAGGAFTISQEISVPGPPSAVLIEDFNRNGKADLLFDGHFANGHGDGTFGAYTTGAGDGS